MSSKIRMLIVDDVEDTRKLIKDMLSFEERIEVVGEATCGEEGIKFAKKLKPDIILMDINMPNMDGLKTTEIITTEMPDAVVIIMSVQSEVEYLKKAMLNGAKEYIVKPFSLEDIISTIMTTYDNERTRKRHIREINTKGTKELRKGKIVSVFSTTGGVGKTTLALNTAISIAKNTGDKVAIVDLDLQFGDITLLSNIKPSKTIVNVIEDFSDMDQYIIEEYMLDYIAGIKILAAPIKPEDSEFIGPEHISKILDMLKEQFHYIIIDTAPSFQDVILSALDKSDKILFVTSMELHSIKNVKLGLEVMDSLNYSEGKVSLIANKSTQKYGIKYKDIQDSLDREVNIFIPDDKKTVTNAINKGYPFMRNRKGGKIYRSLKKLANSITAS